MNPNSEFHVFRDSRRQVRAAELVARLRTSLLQLSSSAPPADVLNLLLLAGELECALADAPALAADSMAASQLTSLVVEAVIAGDLGAATQARSLPCEGVRRLDSIGYRGNVSVGTPEGFAYYALHPLDYSDLIARLHLHKASAFVVGIRSIGTTLSAVVGAKLRQLGIDARRTTVRPTGHPYERQCGLDLEQRQAIARARAAGAEFIVCDEGPGRSGSSLLSVAEALEREGVEAGRILMVCSHQPDVNALCAPRVAERWRRFRCAPTGMTRHLPANADCYAGGGEWRQYFLTAGEEWPAVWPQMERLRYLSCDRRELLTFEGYGPYGVPVSSRNGALSTSGFGARYLGRESGFGKHLLPFGRLLRRDDLTPEMLARMAEYCAWRAREFAVADAEAGALEEMARTNFAREFGEEVDALHLPVERPAICDNRMAPHDWLLTREGAVLKLDAAIHGDDHFFPGPCDIAWDLAGITVEWELSSAARSSLLSQYRRASGDNVASRVQTYEIAYAAFRLGWSRMAAASVARSDGEARLSRDPLRYRRWLRRLTGYRTRRLPQLRAAARLPQARGTLAAPELP